MNNVYNVLEIKSRLIREFEKRGVKPYKILPEIGLSKNTLDSANKSMPKADTLAKIADYFGCSVDYLLGRTDEPSRTGNSLNDLSANKLTIIELFNSLSDTQQGELIGRAKMMVEQNESVFRQEGAV